VQAERTDLYSNPARRRGICYDVKDEIANILVSMVSADGDRGEETVR
jgi:hypothetical protein